MPRRLKPYKVDSVIDAKTGIKFDICLDRETKTFFADIKGICVEAAQADECKAAAFAKIREMVKYEWKKIVVVDSHRHFTPEDSLQLSFQVYEIASTSFANKEAWVERSVGFSNEEPYITPYHGPTENNPGHGTYILPWSEEVVTALEMIQERIALVQDQLRQLLGSEDAPRILKSAVDRILPPHEETP